MSIVRHTYSALLVAEVGGEIVDCLTGNPIKFKCVKYDPFDPRFSCCKMSVEETQEVTELNSQIVDQIKTCGECGRIWALKGETWATLIPE